MTALYMNPETGDVQSWDDWLNECEDWEGDKQAQLDTLQRVLRLGYVGYVEHTHDPALVIRESDHAVVMTGNREACECAAIDLSREHEATYWYCLKDGNNVNVRSSFYMGEKED